CSSYSWGPRFFRVFFPPVVKRVDRKRRYRLTRDCERRIEPEFHRRVERVFTVDPARVLVLTAVAALHERQHVGGFVGVLRANLEVSGPAEHLDVRPLLGSIETR